jgi:hypothetical protein
VANAAQSFQLDASSHVLYRGDAPSKSRFARVCDMQDTLLPGSVKRLALGFDDCSVAAYNARDKCTTGCPRNGFTVVPTTSDADEKFEFENVTKCVAVLLGRARAVVCCGATPRGRS